MVDCGWAAWHLIRDNMPSASKALFIRHLCELFKWQGRLDRVVIWCLQFVRK